MKKFFKHVIILLYFLQLPYLLDKVKVAVEISRLSQRKSKSLPHYGFKTTIRQRKTKAN